jgi:hypothetical protein
MGPRFGWGTGLLATVCLATAGMIAGCGIIGPKPCQVLKARDVAAVLGRNDLRAEDAPPSLDVQAACRYSDATVNTRYSFDTVAELTLITDAKESDALYSPGSPVTVPGVAAARLHWAVETGELTMLELFRGHLEADIAVVALGQSRAEQERQLRALAALVVDRWLSG